MFTVMSITDTITVRNTCMSMNIITVITAATAWTTYIHTEIL